jgi:flagellar biosynthesis/type III secretory pathway M-ring protein FliF/YscJ
VATVADGRQFLALQDAWEARLTDKAVRALERTFPGRAIVTVNLELSPHTENRSGVNVPVDGLQPNLIETMGTPAGMSRGGGDGPSGPLESDPNRAPAVSAFASRLRRDVAGRVYKKQIDVSLYGRKTEVQLAPAIRRITASVVLDEAALATHEDQAATKAAVVDIVKHAIGFDATRGDQMHAPAVMRFTTPPTAAVGTGWDAWSMLAMMLLLFALFGAVWFARRAGSNQPSPNAEALALRMRQEIETAIEHDPEVVAEILGEWAMEARR